MEPGKWWEERSEGRRWLSYVPEEGAAVDRLSLLMLQWQRPPGLLAFRSWERAGRMHWTYAVGESRRLQDVLRQRQSQESAFRLLRSVFRVQQSLRSYLLPAGELSMQEEHLFVDVYGQIALVLCPLLSPSAETSEEATASSIFSALARRILLEVQHPATVDRTYLAQGLQTLQQDGSEALLRILSREEAKRAAVQSEASEAVAAHREVHRPTLVKRLRAFFPTSNQRAEPTLRPSADAGEIFRQDEASSVAYLLREKTGECWPITTAYFRIGSQAAYVDGCLRGNPAISRNQGAICQKGGQYFFLDHHSTNGSFLDGKKLPANQAVPLADGQVLRLGGEDFRFFTGKSNNEKADRRCDRPGLN